MTRFPTATPAVGTLTDKDVPAVALPVFPTFLTKVTAALAAIGKSMKTRTTGDTRNEGRMVPVTASFSSLNAAPIVGRRTLTRGVSERLDGSAWSTSHCWQRWS